VVEAFGFVVDAAGPLVDVVADEGSEATDLLVVDVPHAVARRPVTSTITATTSVGGRGRSGE
jgi:hypothetical protein